MEADDGRGAGSERRAGTFTIGSATIETRTVAAEFLGVALLVFFAVGSAVMGAEYIGTVGISLAFGLTLLALAYALGPVSGCHLNPAVTLGMLLARRIPVRTAIEYWVAQLLGGVVGAALLALVAAQIPGLTLTGAFGSNGFGSRSAVGINTFGAFVAEILLTFLLVYVYLAVTDGFAVVGFAGLAIGMAYAVVNLIGIPLTGASVNPARSLGPAIFAAHGALSQLWLFLIAPLVGGLLAAAVHRATHPALAAVAAETGAAGEPGTSGDPGRPTPD